MAINKRKVPEINGGSMADIAFLLLIFFLVATTIDTDTGIMRKLPPMPKDEEQQDDTKVKERNVFVVLVNKDDELLVEGERMHIKDLRDKTKEFIANPNDREDLPLRKLIDVPYFGMTAVTKNHVISLRNDRGTSYKTYIAVQNELASAYIELRDELATRKWGKKYEELPDEMQDAIRKIYPNRVSEAEPRNIGGD
ncbi:ExbD/TolR family protein [Bacteroidota bacterium]